MKTSHRIMPARELIVLSATGEINLASTKQAIQKLVADPAFDRAFELLLDFRDVDCKLSVVDIFEIASYLGWPSPVLSTGRKIAVLIPDAMPFDQARFLELCSANRGLHLGAFEKIEQAERWLDADLPDELSALPAGGEPAAPPAAPRSGGTSKGN